MAAKKVTHVIRGSPCLKIIIIIASSLLLVHVIVIVLFLFQLQIWDTAGQERFRSITQSYYHSADALVLVFDITSKESFNALPSWLREVEQYASPKVISVLVGKKYYHYHFMPLPPTCTLCISSRNAYVIQMITEGVSKNYPSNSNFGISLKHTRRSRVCFGLLQSYRGWIILLTPDQVMCIICFIKWWHGSLSVIKFVTKTPPFSHWHCRAVLYTIKISLLPNVRSTCNCLIWSWIC